jgi:hypothetical protein
MLMTQDTLFMYIAGNFQNIFWLFETKNKKNAE